MATFMKVLMTEAAYWDYFHRNESYHKVFMQYISILCVPDIIDCGSTNAALSVKWKIIIYFFKVELAVVKGSLPVEFIS